jgi:hypothetical protein
LKILVGQAAIQQFSIRPYPHIGGRSVFAHGDAAVSGLARRSG